MKLPFLGQAYQSRSPVLASQTAINIYPELTEGNSDEIGAFIGTPGLIAKYAQTGEVRGMLVAGGYLFAVIGNTLWKISSNWSSVSMGTLPNSSGRVSMVANETQIAIAHQDGWHWVAIAGSSIAPVSGAPTGSVLTYQDQYGLYTDTGGTFGITTLADLSTLDPLDVADAEGAPDNLVSIISDHREAWLFGETTTEIWANTGAALFPFERSAGGFIEQGCAAKFSPAKLDNSVFWLGRNSNGQGVVYRSNGYTPERISTHAIETAISKYSDISDAIGIAYQDEGHTFYWLIFPTGNASWVYDVATKGWHQRAWLDSNGLLNRHRANCYATFNGMHLIGDWQNGTIYQMSLDIYTDNNEEIYRERAFDLPESEEKKARYDQIQLFGTFGDGASPTDPTSPQVWMQISRDGGRIWGYQRVINVGAIGQTKYRARWRRVGTGRNPVIRFATTMKNRVQWVHASASGEEYDQ